MRILLAEDDEVLGDGVKKSLLLEGYTVDWIKDGSAAERAIRAGSFDLIILDIGLPKLSGLEVLVQVRNRGHAIPVLILTARDTIQDRIKGLDTGADDYLAKPFDLGELSARIRALIRRASGRADTTITYRDLIIDPASHSATYRGETLNIPRREFALLQKLLEHTGHVLSREQLMQTLYGWEDDVDSNALEVHIHNLRKKLDPSYIRTIRGVGYIVEKPQKPH